MKLGLENTVPAKNLQMGTESIQNRFVQDKLRDGGSCLVWKEKMTTSQIFQSWVKGESVMGENERYFRKLI